MNSIQNSGNISNDRFNAGKIKGTQLVASPKQTFHLLVLRNGVANVSAYAATKLSKLWSYQVNALLQIWKQEAGISCGFKNQ
jgi:hypothetical protein